MPGVTIPENTIVSCLTIGIMQGKTKYMPVTKPTANMFVQGAIFKGPRELQLSQSQMMGQQSPYLQNAEESDLELSEDELEENTK